MSVATDLSRTGDPKNKGDLGIVSVTDPPSPRLVVATPFMEYGGDVSPDLRWFAFRTAQSRT